MLLIPGLAAGSHSWGVLLTELRRRFRCLLVDHRVTEGNGAPDAPCTTAEMAADCLGALDALGVDRAHVLGFSLGGMIAQELALAHPDRIGRMVLANTGATLEGPSREHVRRLRTLAQEGRIAAFVESLLERSFSEPYRRENGRMVALFGLTLSASIPPASAVLRQIEALETHDTRTRACGIRAPVLVLSSGDDVLTPPQAGRDLSRRIPAAAFQLLPAVGHAAFIESTEDFLNAVLTHLDGECPTGSRGRALPHTAGGQEWRTS
ncbi:MAG: alpha/beta fold hydrolase [Deltaproteobacteria bacterium]|nr:alpha/beta fold hydrolase [Deltaproteobacteria bacterium]